VHLPYQRWYNGAISACPAEVSNPEDLVFIRKMFRVLAPPFLTLSKPLISLTEQESMQDSEGIVGILSSAFRSTYEQLSQPIVWF
jgi:hypothetical protein